jgi:hypothetical protein
MYLLGYLIKLKNTYINKYITDKCSLFIDSTIIYNKYGVTKVGRNKFYKNKKATKITLITDKYGFPLSVLFMKDNYHDNRVFETHIKDALVIIPNKKLKIIADKAYSSKSNYLFLDKKNIEHIICIYFENYKNKNLIIKYGKFIKELLDYKLPMYFKNNKITKLNKYGHGYI